MEEEAMNKESGLEAMRTKKCLENFHLESLEKLGESFLKYVVSIQGEAKIKSKRVADVVEALIGAYLSSGEEVKTLSFMKRLGLEIDFANAPMLRHFPMNAEKLVNVRYLESLLHYKFHDPSLLVEELTHASYMLP
ncbi:Endoribonuclease Dicer -like protein 2 [Capsicum chinense]|nr:Endoribonuclease Dicer -like protein 2 [Capsicum chinense]